MLNSLFRKKTMIKLVLCSLLFLQPWLTPNYSQAIDPGRFYIKPEAGVSLAGQSIRLGFIQEGETKQTTKEANYKTLGSNFIMALGYNIASDLALEIRAGRNFAEDKASAAGMKRDDITTTLAMQYYFNSDSDIVQPFIGAFAGFIFTELDKVSFRNYDFQVKSVERENALTYGMKLGTAFPVRQNIALELDAGIWSSQRISFSTSVNQKPASLNVADLGAAIKFGVKFFF